MLDQLHEQHKVRIIAIDRWLRIRGTLNAASSAADHIAAVLSRVRTRRFDMIGLKDWTAKCRTAYTPFLTKPHLLRGLGHLRVSLSYKMGPPMKAPGSPETPLTEHYLDITAFDDVELDNAQQVLLQLLNTPNAGDRIKILEWPFNIVSLPVNITAIPNLHRSVPLLRGELATEGEISASNKAGEAASHPPYTIPTTNLESALRTYQCTVKFQADEGTEINFISWHQSPQQTTSAKLGLHLHSERPVKPSNRLLDKRKTRQKKSEVALVSPLSPHQRFDSLFVSSADHAFKWLSKVSEVHPDTFIGPPSNRTKFQFDFVPTPFTDVNPSPLATQARVSLHLDNDPESGTSKFSHWSAHLGNADIIVPLPHLVTDVKLSNAFQLVSTETGNGQLQSTIQYVQDSIAQGGTLRAPPTIEVNGPQISYTSKDIDPWESRRGSSNLWGSTWNPDSAGTRTYLFAGVQFKQILNLTWKPFDEGAQYPLAYTVVDCGRTGGRRTELTLELPKDVEVNDNSQTAMEARKRFLEASVELASQVTAAAKDNVAGKNA